jgi:hypothetical protein
MIDPIDQKNPLHPDQTSVSVARRCERAKGSAPPFFSPFHKFSAPTNGRGGQSKRVNRSASKSTQTIYAGLLIPQ